MFGHKVKSRAVFAKLILSWHFGDARILQDSD